MADDAFALIKNAIRLSEYASRFTKVKSMGGSGYKFMAFCPFHDNTKTEALSIDDQKGLWKCFASCGGGSIIDFWLKQHDMDPRDPGNFGLALEGLAGEVGVTLPEREQTGGRDEISKSRIKKAIKRVAEAACDNLFSDDNPEYVAAMTYLTDERHMSEKLIEHYLIGMFPSNGKEAAKFVAKHSDDIPAAIAGGILGKNERDDSLWTPFAGRMVVPIFDRTGAVIALGGREVPGVEHAGQGKWTNPTTTPVYDKSKTLYGVDQIEKGDSVVVVEGYFDAIAITESSIDAVGVAACGTAFTRDHIDVIRHAKSVSFIFDGDDAGSKALANAHWVANQRNDATYVTLPKGTDPWELMYGVGDGEPDRKSLVNAYGSQNPLLEGAVKAKRSVAESDSDFDEWVAASLANLHDTFSKDSFLANAAAERGISRASYARVLSGIKITRGRDFASDSETGIGQLNQNTEALAKRILQLSDQEHASVFALISEWNSATEAIITEWFPGAGDADTNVYERLITGGLDMDPNTARATDVILSSLLPEGNAELVDITRPIKAIITMLGRDAEKLAKHPNISSELRQQILGLRNLSEMSEKVEYQTFVLSTIVDTAVAMRRFARAIERETP